MDQNQTRLLLSESEIDFSFVRSSGPGGQNVNKVATTAQLRFNVLNTACLSEIQKEKIMERLKSRITESGDIIITARRFRTQERNRIEGVERLTLLLNKALEEKKPRKKSKPSKAVVEKRLKSKQIQKLKKESRKAIDVSGYG